MKIVKEKRIREEYTAQSVETVVGRMMKMVTGKGTGEKKKGYRNVCKETGRSRGVIKGKVRME